MVYNANYAKFCDRARQAAAGVDSLATLQVHQFGPHLTNFHKVCLEVPTFNVVLWKVVTCSRGVRVVRFEKL